MLGINLARRKNMEKGIWKNEEVKDLFEVVEKYKKENKSLRFAFAEHAQKYQRKPNSVRNYYYHEVDNLKFDNRRRKEIGIDLKNHEKSEIKYFSLEEENSLMKKIDMQVRQGISVRKACQNLSDGNVELMLRYQNKYRNFLSKQKPKENTSNIIKFAKKRETLSDGELQSLFMGLVRLVRKNAYEEANEKLILNYEKTNDQLRKTIVELHGKERELQQLKSEFLKLKNENEKLINGLNRARSDKAEKLKEKLTSKRLNNKMYN